MNHGHLLVIMPAIASILGIVCTTWVSIYVITQQTRVLRRDARAQALKELCLYIAEWMHDPKKWEAMASEFWRVGLWLNPKQATEIKQRIGEYDPKVSSPKNGGEHQTGEKLFEVLTKDIV
jgi:hypothetical protein